MTKETQKSTSIPKINVFIGRCWSKKYDNMYHAVERHVKEKYNSKVLLNGGYRRCPQSRKVVLVCFADLQILSYITLCSSAFIFLILMFSKPVVFDGVIKDR